MVHGRNMSRRASGDRLGYDPADITRAVRYTRYVDDERMLAPRAPQRLEVLVKVRVAALGLRHARPRIRRSTRPSSA